VQVDGYRLPVGCSIGVALYPRDGRDGRSLLKNADTALYRTKAEGRGTFRFFELEMDRSLQERRALEHDLRLALQHDRLEVYFQPESACDTLQVVGFEALVRWRDPTRGLVPPGIFIPIAEECGLIEQLGRIVLERACALAASWQPRCRIAVNLSPSQFRNHGLPNLLSDILERTGLPARLLELEVTEGVLIRDEEQALSILRGLKAQGVRIALDDFGTGYSSLSYLRRFPFDKIKIDKSFVQAQQSDPGAQAILETILAMSGRLNLTVTAEGVETEEQLAMIRRQRCTEVQGYLLARPMPSSQVPAFLQAANSSSAANHAADAMAEAAD
jgi:EAL domain-containing protein (putative c-di-GMP-specific phosphodiesterase class I)